SCAASLSDRHFNRISLRRFRPGILPPDGKTERHQHGQHDHSHSQKDLLPAPQWFLLHRLADCLKNAILLRTLRLVLHRFLRLVRLLASARTPVPLHLSVFHIFFFCTYLVRFTYRFFCILFFYSYRFFFCILFFYRSFFF